MDVPMAELLNRVLGEIKVGAARPARQAGEVGRIDGRRWRQGIGGVQPGCGLVHLDEARGSEKYFDCLEHVERITSEFELC